MTTAPTEGSSNTESTSHTGASGANTPAHDDKPSTSTSSSTTNTDTDKEGSDKATDKEKESTGEGSGDKHANTSPPEIDHVETPTSRDPKLGPTPGMRDKPTVGTADESGKVTDLSSLKEQDIRKILDTNNLFKGIKLRGEEFPESTQYLVDSEKTPFNWSALHEASVVATTVYSERSARLVEQGWTKTAANFSSPWISGGIEVSKNESHASESTKRYLYTTGSYVLKKMKVTIDKVAASKHLTKEFLGDVKKAMDEPAVEQRLDRLRDVFKKYGHVFMTSVIIGTSMITSLKQEQTSKVTADSVEKSLKVKVAAKWGAFSGGAAHGSGSTTESGSTSDDQNSSLTFTTKGGNNAFANNPGKWLETTGDHKLWTVIMTEEVVPLTELLFLYDPQLGESVNQTVPRPLIGKFIFEQPKLGDYDPDIFWCVHRPGEQWSKQGWYWLGSSNDSYHLLVREAEKGALGLIEKLDTINSGLLPSFSDVIDTTMPKLISAFPMVKPLVSNAWYISAPVPVNQEEYVVLGHVHSRSSSVPDGLRAVRNDLVIKGTPRNFSLPILALSQDNIVQGWGVEPDLLEHDDTEFITMSYFYYVKPNNNEAPTRDQVLRSKLPLYLLKKSAVLFTNTMRDAKEEWDRSHPA